MSEMIQLLPGIFLHVVQRVVIDEAVSLISHSESFPLTLVRIGSSFPATFVSEQVTVRPVDLLLFDQWQQAASFNLIRRNLCSRKRRQSGKNVEMSCDSIDVAIRRDSAVPSDE